MSSLGRRGSRYVVRAGSFDRGVRTVASSDDLQLARDEQRRLLGKYEVVEIYDKKRREYVAGGSRDRAAVKRTVVALRGRSGRFRSPLFLDAQDRPNNLSDYLDDLFGRYEDGDDIADELSDLATAIRERGIVVYQSGQIE